ncbi:MAG: hypothetical protein ACREM3_20760, partial [Candidatus Rokuibacteriota bacterium]
WVEGQSGSSNTYTVRLDGRVMGVKTSPGAHVYFTVPTTASTNGRHTITATVRDATGKTGTSSVAVTVRN